MHLDSLREILKKEESNEKADVRKHPFLEADSTWEVSYATEFMSHLEKGTNELACPDEETKVC